MSGNEYRFKLSNNGNLIPDSVHPHLFEYGFSTQTDSKGFGLANVQKVIEAHGWRIELANTKTTTFIISIPVSDSISYHPYP